MGNLKCLTDKIYINKIKLKESLKNENWGAVCKDTDIDSSVNNSINTLQRHIKYVTAVKQLNSKKKPSAIRGIRLFCLAQLGNTKCELLNKANKYPTNPIFTQQYRNYTNNINKPLDIAYIKYCKSGLDKYLKQSEKLWKNQQSKEEKFCYIKENDSLSNEKHVIIT